MRRVQKKNRAFGKEIDTLRAVKEDVNEEKECQ